MTIDEYKKLIQSKKVDLALYYMFKNMTLNAPKETDKLFISWLEPLTQMMIDAPYPCTVCSRPMFDYIPVKCCSGLECGCMGLPIEPPICSQTCFDNFGANLKTNNLARIGDHLHLLEVDDKKVFDYMETRFGATLTQTECCDLIDELLLFTNVRSCGFFDKSMIELSKDMPF